MVVLLFGGPQLLRDCRRFDLSPRTASSPARSWRHAVRCSGTKNPTQVRTTGADEPDRFTAEIAEAAERAIISGKPGESRGRKTPASSRWKPRVALRSLGSSACSARFAVQLHRWGESSLHSVDWRNERTMGVWPRKGRVSWGTHCDQMLRSKFSGWASIHVRTAARTAATSPNSPVQISYSSVSETS